MRVGSNHGPLYVGPAIQQRGYLWFSGNVNQFGADIEPLSSAVRLLRPQRPVRQIEESGVQNGQGVPLTRETPSLWTDVRCKVWEQHGEPSLPTIVEEGFDVGRTG